MKLNNLKKINIYMIGAVSALSGLLFGFDTGIISGAQKFILKTFEMNNNNLINNFINGFMVASVPTGALIGSIMSSLYVKKIGRKQSISLSALLFMIGTITASIANHINIVILGRIIIGYSIGISSMVTPLYLSEISPTKVRGSIIFLFQLAVTIGLLSAFGLNIVLYQHFTNYYTNWRYMFRISAIPSLLLFFGMFYMPNSPRYLLFQGKVKEAKNLMQNLLGKQDVNEEINNMINNINHKENINLKIFLKKPYFSLIIIAFGLFIFQQLSGINAIMYYGPEIFKNAGFGIEAKFWAQLIMGIINVLATIIGIWLIDRIGRKPLLITGLSGIIISLITASYSLSSYNNFPIISLLSILFFVLFFAFSLGGVPYILMSELFPLKLRPTGMALASCANWSFNMIVSSSFILLYELLGGISQIFLLYAAFSFIGLLFVIKYVPETKGKSLEEIEKNLLQ